MVRIKRAVSSRPGHEELSHGLFRHDPVDDEDRARRDQDAEAATGGDDARRQGGIVVVLLHLRQGDRRHRGRRRAGRAADGGEAGAGPDGGDGHAARQVPEELVGGVEEPAADPRMVGDLSHQDEQGDHRQVVGAEGGEEIAREKAQGGIPGGEQGEADEADDRHDEPHGDPDEHQQDQEGEADQAGGDGRHAFTARMRERRDSASRSRASSPLPRAIP
jgi:hypothetical protein